MSEFRRFLETLRMLGIAFEVNWGPNPAQWQTIMHDAGYGITARSTTLVVVGGQEFLFANGVADVVGDSELGPRGVFLLSRNIATGEVINRVAYNFTTGEMVSNVSGLQALRFHHKY